MVPWRRGGRLDEGIVSSVRLWRSLHRSCRIGPEGAVRARVREAQELDGQGGLPEKPGGSAKLGNRLPGGGHAAAEGKRSAILRRRRQGETLHSIAAEPGDHPGRTGVARVSEPGVFIQAVQEGDRAIVVGRHHPRTNPGGHAALGGIGIENNRYRGTGRLYQPGQLLEFVQANGRRHAAAVSG